MRILLFVLCILLVSSFTGCSTKQDVVTKTVYVEKECPTPLPKNEFISYEVLILEIDEEIYYAFPKKDALIMTTNWLSYRAWAEANYTLIKKED